MKIALLPQSLFLTTLLVAAMAHARGASVEGAGAQRPLMFQAPAAELRCGYLLFLPKNYAAQSGPEWPLILFLHGAGERGDDLDLVALAGPPKLVQQRPDFPFVVLSPQCPKGQAWDAKTVMALLDHVQATHRIDRRRVYVTGLSMGGYGTWRLAALYPERFAAAVPICGGGEASDMLLATRDKRGAHQALGVWAFHGGKDTTVPLSESERMVEIFRKAGVADIKLSVDPAAGHDSWTKAYADPQLYDWLLAHRRP
ncbi:MAG: Endo,4-beta-xylanase precursor [Verrucomicrobiota bacterium]|jgi:predicted peptidase